MKRLALPIACLALLSSTALHARLPDREVVIPVPGFADFLAVDGKGVWATNRGRVERWTAKGMTATVPLSRPCGAMAVAFGSLWVANCQEGALYRIDLKTAKVTAVIPTGIANPKGELNVVAGAGSIWVPSVGTGMVARVDPATNSVIATIPVVAETFYMTFGHGALWAVSGPQQLIQRIDPASNSVTKTAKLGGQPGFLVADGDAVWVQEQADGTVARIDPASVEVTGRVQVGKDLLYGDIDAGDGKLWLRTTTDQTFAVIDARTMAVVARLGQPVGSGGLRYTRKGVWTTAHDKHILSWWPIR